MNKRPTLARFREKAMENPDVQAAYEAMAPTFEVKRRMIALRKQAGLTQEQMADRLGTKKSNISRLESLGHSGSPRLATIEEYARVLGYNIKVAFEPQALRDALDTQRNR